MGIWRVARHAPGRPDSPSPVIRRRTPSRTPPKAPVKTKSVSRPVQITDFLSKLVSILYMLVENDAPAADRPESQAGEFPLPT
eukprot:736613-Pelagomonas_calceolata.AAC.1